MTTTNARETIRRTAGECYCCGKKIDVEFEIHAWDDPDGYGPGGWNACGKDVVNVITQVGTDLECDDEGGDHVAYDYSDSDEANLICSECWRLIHGIFMLQDKTPVRALQHKVNMLTRRQFRWCNSLAKAEKTGQQLRVLIRRQALMDEATGAEKAYFCKLIHERLRDLAENQGPWDEVED